MKELSPAEGDRGTWSEWHSCPPNSWISGFDIFLNDYKWPLYHYEDSYSAQHKKYLKPYNPKGTSPFGHDTLGVTRMIFMCTDKDGNQQGM